MLKICWLMTDIDTLIYRSNSHLIAGNSVEVKARSKQSEKHRDDISIRVLSNYAQRVCSENSTRK